LPTDDRRRVHGRITQLHYLRFAARPSRALYAINRPHRRHATNEVGFSTSSSKQASATTGTRVSNPQEQGSEKDSFSDVCGAPAMLWWVHAILKSCLPVRNGLRERTFVSGTEISAAHWEIHSVWLLPTASLEMLAGTARETGGHGAEGMTKWGRWASGRWLADSTLAFEQLSLLEPACPCASSCSR
jgi:hypothetical protein